MCPTRPLAGNDVKLAGLAAGSVLGTNCAVFMIKTNKTPNGGWPCNSRTPRSAAHSSCTRNAPKLSSDFYRMDSSNSLASLARGLEPTIGVKYICDPGKIRNAHPGNPLERIRD